MSLTYTESKVIWKYKGKQYEYNIGNIKKAYMEEKKIYIYSSEYQDKVYVHANTDITLEGLLIVSHYAGTDTDKIKILDENGKELFIEFPYRVEVRTNGNIIIIIEIDKVIQYSIHGKKLKEYSAPNNYSIGRFFDAHVDKDVKIICHGPEDKYGKDTYCLSLNLETGEWTVLYSMLDK
jgi:hypothetical protein